MIVLRDFNATDGKNEGGNYRPPLLNFCLNNVLEREGGLLPLFEYRICHPREEKTAKGVACERVAHYTFVSMERGTGLDPELREEKK